MGHDSIGDFAYIGTFPDYDTGVTNNNDYNGISSYEMNPRGYESFQQTYNVQHLNRSFNPESPESYASPRLQQQQELYPQAPIAVHRAYSEPYVVQQQQQQQQQQIYPEPALVDTHENETPAFGKKHSGSESS
ncbi:hypothetical protein BGW39_001854 [Mortierella sp. 14UC]|nr:hypothetical protein BGW39_001854 [Mortierella sp. 14UC]